MHNKKYKVPIILYESEEQALPYIEVLEQEEMPPTLFIQEYKHTGEIEPGLNGEDQLIVDMSIHMFVDMEVLADKLTPERYDEVRVAFGLQPYKRLGKPERKSWIRSLEMSKIVPEIFRKLTVKRKSSYSKLSIRG